MGNLLWILQIGLGIFFIGTGVMHFVVPEGLPQPMAWMYDLPQTMHQVSGTAEVLGGLGLILPSVTRILPLLTPLAAAGLTVVMILAAAWHAGRGEVTNIAMNLVLAALLVFVGWRRASADRISART
jgi:uncharacterized membrane protein